MCQPVTTLDSRMKAGLFWGPALPLGVVTVMLVFTQSQPDEVLGH